MSLLLETLSKAGNYISGTAKKVADISESAVNSVADLGDSIAKANDSIRNASLPGSSDLREKLGKMCDAGYGEHFIDAHRALLAGEAVDAGSLTVLQRFGLADASGKAA